MERKNGKLFYFCSIPKRNVIPDSFIYKEVPPYKYLVVEHIGSLGKIYETYGKAYQEILPNTNYIPLQENFLHFERYDYRFQWNIEMCTPLRIIRENFRKAKAREKMEQLKTLLNRKESL